VSDSEVEIESEIDVNLDDISPDVIIEWLREELDEMPENDLVARRQSLNRLGYAVLDRHFTTGGMADLDEAIQIARQVIDMTPGDDLEWPRSLYSLGTRLGERYSRLGATADFEEAEHAIGQVILTPSGDLKPAEIWSYLGQLFSEKYTRTGNPDDLEEAIRIARQAVEETIEGDPDWVACVNNLGLRLSDRYSSTGNGHDLEEATRLARRALEAASDDHPDYPGLWNNLGARIGDQYSRTAALADLEEAIRHLRRGVEKLPSEHEAQALLLSNLGHHLGLRFIRTGASSDLEEAIQVLRDALRKTPDHDPGRAASLNNLGLQFGARYLSAGSTADLDESIQYLQQAVDVTPEDHPNRKAYLHNLGGQLGDRYLRTGAIIDVDEAVRIVHQAIDATPKQHPNMEVLQASLGALLNIRYSRTKVKADLDAAIQATRHGLDCTSISNYYLNRAVLYNVLAVLLGKKYAENHAIADREEAIQAARQAVDATPQGHQSRAGVLNNLGDELSNRYLETKNEADLEEALNYTRQALETMPQDDPGQSALLCNLGDQLNSRYTAKGALEDHKNAIAYYQAALNQANSYTVSRIWAGRAVLRHTLDQQQAYEAASLAVSLVPKLLSRSLQNSDKQHALSQVVGLASDAAAAALQAGQAPLVALGLLEMGRGVLAASLEEMRTDILDLREREFELAEQFLRLRDELETPMTNNPQMMDGNLERSRQVQASRRYEAGKEFEKLVSKIQKLPGFEDFLLPPREMEMKAAAQCGPIVLVNISKIRCDALLVEPHQIRALALTQLSIEEIEDMAVEGDLGSHEVLEWLWDKVAKQVLDALGFIHPPSSGESWPHVWWIPTGPLSKFPLHAAGQHTARLAETVLDRVMSSYASTVQAIIQGRQRLQPNISAQALLVAMEHTPGNDVLPFATKEVAIVRDLCKSMSVQPVESGCRKQDVKSHLRDCRIFHFAGHGGTDEYDASNSRLLLKDGALRVAELLDMNLLERAPFLAYLSACGTGRIRDERSVDESIHLINAFQLAGFRHVIGTLWEVRDGVCVEMAKIMYEGMRDGAMTDESVCHGLHQASRTLRDQWLELRHEGEDRSLSPVETFPGSTRHEVRKGDHSLRDTGLFDAGPGNWVPYIHFGI
jgi:hypothetical protein